MNNNDLIKYEMLQDLVIPKLRVFEIPRMGVYLLWDKGELVYIGESVNSIQRMYQHLRDKIFDSYSFIKCTNKQEAMELEKVLIKRFKPRVNIRYNKQRSENIKRSIMFHKNEIEKLNELKEIC